MNGPVPFGEEAPKPSIDIEAGLVTAVLDTGDIKSAVTKKITPAFFTGSSKPIWEFMTQHYREHKKVPELAVINRKFPQFKPVATAEPVDYFIGELQDRQRYNIILNGMKDISAGLNAKNSMQAMKDLTRLVSLVNTEVQIHRDINWNHEVDERIARIKNRMQTMGVDGISYGIEALDNATGGMHWGELISIVAKSGVGKTYFELALIAKPAMMDGQDVLFISREMEAWKIEDRMDAIYFEIAADKMKRGLFTTDEFAEYEKGLRSIKDMNIGNLIISADDEKGFGLMAIQAKIEEHLPNGGVVIVDGSYLLDDDEANGRRNDYEKIVSITRGLKRMARRTQCVICQSSQLGRGQKRGKSVDLDNISFSSSFEQDSDIVFGLYQSDEMKEVGKMGLEGSKVRDGDNPKLILQWDFATMKDFGMMAEDITDAPDDDDDVIY